MKTILALLGCLGFQAAAAALERLANEHVDISIHYTDGLEPTLGLVIQADRERAFATTNVILVVLEQAKLALPPGTPFGDEGDPIWALPQSQDPELLYMGFSAEQIPAGLFDGPLQIRLASVDGPGDFFVWQATSAGELDLKMNSRDGISAEDRTEPVIGSHEHMNWGFTTNGIYRVNFIVEGRRAGESTNIASQPIPLLFHVLPLPLSPFAQWQLEKFNADAPEEGRGAGSDPDHDQLPNIFEYYFAQDPLNPPRGAGPRGWISGTEAGLEFAQAIRAADVLADIQFKDDLNEENWRPAAGTFRSTDAGMETRTVRFTHDAPPGARRFYRLQLSLVP